jgi:hypothetical protein
MDGVLQAVATLTHARGLSDLNEQRLVMQLVMSQILSQNYQLWAVSLKRVADYSV